MNKKLKNTIIILCVVLGVVALGVGTFLLLSGSPKSDKELITESISKSIGSVKESLSGEISNLFEDKNAIVKLTTDTKLSMNDGYDNQDLAFQGDFYVSLKEIYANMKLAQGLEEELNVEMLFKDNKFYHKVKDVYSRFYYTDAELNVELETNKSDMDFLVVLNYLSDSLTEQFNDKELTKDDEATITLGGKEFEVNKLTAKFTEKDLLEIVQSLINKIKNDKEFYNSIIDAYETVNAELPTDEQIDIEKELNSLIDELKEAVKEADDKETLFKYTVYLDGEDILSAVITVILDPEESMQNISLGINTYENKDKNDVLEYYVSMAGIKLATMKFESINDNETNISAQVYQMLNVDGKLKESDKESTLNLKVKINAGEEEIEVLSLDMATKEVEKDKKYDFNFNVLVNYDEMKIDLKSSNTFEEVKSIPEVDLTDAADISEMTEEEKQFLELFM
ncbi:MAG: hypothetical protein J6A52_02685 [Bacilli bacterium]|nr:hypothetical protein [Bacilli bacterium]